MTLLLGVASRPEIQWLLKYIDVQLFDIFYSEENIQRNDFHE